MTPADAAKLQALSRMKLLATGLLIVMALIFAVSFALQGRFPWLEYVRAASEGGMVGALADWFAVTALFRHPLGLKIPHTAIIPTRKNEIGATLGDFVEENFLSAEVVRDKLASVGISRVVGGWLAKPANAGRLTAEVSAGLTGAMAFLDDDDIRAVIESLARTHLVGRDWSPQLGVLAAKVLDSGQHHHAVDLLVDKTEEWLVANPDSFSDAVSKRLPTWVPSFVDRVVDDRAYREALKFVQAVQADPDHRVRVALDDYLRQLAEDLQHNPVMRLRVEGVKEQLLDDPRIRDLAATAWQSIKDALLASLADPASALRVTLESTVTDIGVRLGSDDVLAQKVDTWVEGAATHLLSSYRHDIAAVIAETVERWDGDETSQKIELQVGKDLQFIRINGTVVGSLAGLAIFTVAQGLVSLAG
ncbi:DUF445 domain-containing protein [Subtercola boreus]|uniref:DUF445 domain-containing protein n=1 Tax=Subtercola boreus TaxID=120213 RepID=A0A3E0WAH0_9MICO|nr:DUF445 domain-containing protein [Subtercola boreus]RFA20075.1 hypothetical protein B7R24_10280 [Subtercola boreus]RFA20205.1 hypothetical protein B7R23_10220 [Subtercola boreus]RFA26530.1 hypothetical protein B7R25_10345 [Subtercola boreus]